MIHVCSLARLHATVDETGARHIVTLLRLVDRVQRPSRIAPENHLVLAVDDITIGGLGERSVTVERRSPSSYGQEPSPEPSPS